MNIIIYKKNIYNKIKKNEITYVANLLLHNFFIKKNLNIWKK